GRYVCDNFLAEAGNPFHRYLMHVLLRYLFKRDQAKVLHWLRDRKVADSFLKDLGADERIDRKYKIFDAIKLLISLFTPEVACGLVNPKEAAERARGKVFFLAFDQIEGRAALFDSDKDWFTFFAQVAELYNALPNV